MTANTHILETNLRFWDNLNVESFNCTRKVKNIPSFKIHAWLNCRKDYMTVTFEPMGFSNKNISSFLFIHVFNLSGKFSVALGNCNATCAAPDQTRAGRYLLKEIAACGETKLEKQMMGKTHSEAEGKCEEEGATERSCHGLTAAPHSPSPCAAWHGRGGRGVRNKGERLVCVSQYLTLCLIANELNYFSLFCP